MDSGFLGRISRLWFPLLVFIFFAVGILAYIAEVYFGVTIVPIKEALSLIGNFLRDWTFEMMIILPLLLVIYAIFNFTKLTKHM